MEATMTVYTDYLELEVDYEFDGFFTPGKYCGSPENCYPDDSDLETIIEKVTIIDNNRKIVVPFEKLRNSVRASIEEQVIEDALDRIENSSKYYDNY